MKRLWRFLCGVLLACALLPAQAGVMTRESMVAAFPAPLVVGEKERDLPVWPIYAQDLTSSTLVAYAFESIDFAPIPGFSGTPMNLLVALNKDGSFMEVRVLSQHEPVFLDGLGPQPLFKFVEQYRQLSLRQNIKIGLGNAQAGKAGSAAVHIDGVAKATASVRILNQSLLAASLKVARARMGYGEGTDPDLIARVRPEVYESMDWDGLQSAGLVARKVLSNAQVEEAFRGTAVEGADEQTRMAPDQSFVEFYLAYLDVPSVGRNLLPPPTWDYLQKRLEPGDHALLVMSKGRYAIVPEDFQRGSVPERLTLSQNQLPLEMRDLDLDTTLQLPPALQDATWRVFRVISAAGLDPSQPLRLELLVSRSKGQFMPEVVNRSFALDARLPGRYFEAASSDSKTWMLSWTSRWPELLLLVVALALLGWALGKPAWLAQSPQRLQRFRTGYLLFTAGFIGFYAQGQLSIVNLTAVLQAVLAGRSLGFLLYDPMTVLLWVFAALTFVLWGRGTFCGWLCPFGALQEFISKVARLLRMPSLRVPTVLDARLKQLKYLLLALVLLSACGPVAWTDRLVELEPFKTTITLNLVREWPYVLWAVATLLLSAFVYKGYCRYLCPLGGGMALLGRLRRFDWIARRSECGSPCQRCRSDCAYQAIEKSGKVDYTECFQCMDCVLIYQSETLCVPEFNRARGQGVRTIPIVPAGGQP